MVLFSDISLLLSARMPLTCLRFALAFKQVFVEVSHCNSFH